MAEKTTKTKGAATSVPAAVLNRIAAELTSRRRPMTLAELLEFTGE